MSDANTTADTLVAKILNPQKRPLVLNDCVRVIEDEVGSKSGLSGLAIKGAFKVVSAVKPGIIREAMDHLLDDFVGRLEPLYKQHRAAGGSPSSFASFMLSKKNDVANSLLGITDDRASRAKNPTLKSAYQQLRPQAQKHVEEAIPRIANTLGKYL